MSSALCSPAWSVGPRPPPKPPRAATWTRTSSARKPDTNSAPVRVERGRNFRNRWRWRKADPALAPPALLSRAFTDGDLDIHVLVVAAQPYRSRLPRDEGRHQVQHRVRILDRFALDRNQDIAGLQSGPFGGSTSQHALDEYTVEGAQAQGFAHFRSDFPGLDTDPSARDAAGLDDLFHDVLCARCGDRKADAERPPRARVDRRVDADQVPSRVDERSAGVARIDRGVGLDEVLESVDAELAAAECRDDAHRHGLSHSERVADCKHDVADAQGIGVAESDRGDRPAFDLQDGDVGFRIGTDGFGFQFLTVNERYLDLVGRLDHVVIGENVSLGTHDHARAEACRALRFVLETVPEEMPEQRVVEERMARRLDFFAGENVHD